MPGIDGAGGPESVLSRKEAALDGFYADHCPERVGTAKQVLQKFKGRHIALYNGTTSRRARQRRAFAGVCT